MRRLGVGVPPGSVGGTRSPGRGLPLSVTGAALAGSLEEDSPRQSRRPLGCWPARLLPREPPRPHTPGAASQLRVRSPVPGRGDVSRGAVGAARRARVTLRWLPGRPASRVGRGRGTATGGRSHPPATFTPCDEDWKQPVVSTRSLSCFKSLFFQIPSQSVLIHPKRSLVW